MLGDVLQCKICADRSADQYDTFIARAEPLKNIYGRIDIADALLMLRIGKLLIAIGAAIGHAMSPQVDRNTLISFLLKTVRQSIPRFFGCRHHVQENNPAARVGCFVRLAGK